MARPASGPARAGQVTERATRLRGSEQRGAAQGVAVGRGERRPGGRQAGVHGPADEARGRDMEPRHVPGRGRDARRPREIPLRGWKDVLARVVHEVGRDQIDIVAAGVAFYALLALFPALIAVVSLYGLVASPATVATQIEEISGVLPPDVARMVSEQLTEIVSTAPSHLTLGVAFSLALSFWTASSGVMALIDGVNIAYDEEDTRTYLQRRTLATVLTFGALVVTLILLAGIVVVPVWVGRLGIGDLGSWVTVGRWPLLVLIFAGSASVLYRYGPDRMMARWRWVWGGAAVAAVLWLGGSLGFSLYVSWFGRFNTTYGALGAVVMLLLWLYISAFILLLGAELNAEAERQTMVDTTIPPEVRMGARGAHVADTLGPTAAELKGGDHPREPRIPRRPPEK